MNIAERVFNALTDGTDGLRAFYSKMPARGTDGYILPLIVIVTGLGGHDEQTLGGRDGLMVRVIRLDVWGKSRKFADDYMAVATTKMDAATTFKVGAADESGAPAWDESSELYRASVDFRLWFNQ